MRLRIHAFGALAIGIAAGFAARAATVSGGASPSEVVTAFFRAYLTLPAGGGIPDAKARAVIEPYLSPALDQLLIAADQAEDRYAATTKNEDPPLWEGDVFSSNFEGVSSFGSPDCNWTGARGTCSVMLTYDDKTAKPVTWTDKIRVVEVGQAWLVDDIEYGGAWDFGNKGTLKDNLMRVIEDAKETAQ
jgi:hypothetical protein